MQDRSWKGFRTENIHYSSGSYFSAPNTETRRPVRCFQPANVSCQGAETEDAQHSAVVKSTESLGAINLRQAQSK